MQLEYTSRSSKRQACLRNPDSVFPESADRVPSLISSAAGSSEYSNVVSAEFPKKEKHEKKVVRYNPWFEQQGAYLALHRPQGVRRGGGKRGPCRGFSKQSRRRLQVLLSTIDYEELARRGIKQFQEWRLSFPLKLWDVSQSTVKWYKSCIDKFGKKFLKKYPDAFFVWRFEFFQKSDDPWCSFNPHFHLLVFMPWCDWSWVHWEWADIVGDPVVHTHFGQVESVSRMRGYISKYVGKLGNECTDVRVMTEWRPSESDSCAAGTGSDGESLLILPSSHISPASVLSGRVWGVIGGCNMAYSVKSIFECEAQRDPETEKIYHEVAVKIARCLRKWYERQGHLRGKHRSMVYSMCALDKGWSVFTGDAALRLQAVVNWACGEVFVFEG